jgi:hypothetical protein
MSIRSIVLILNIAVYDGACLVRLRQLHASSIAGRYGSHREGRGAVGKDSALQVVVLS